MTPEELKQQAEAFKKMIAELSGKTFIDERTKDVYTLKGTFPYYVNNSLLSIQDAKALKKGDDKEHSITWDDFGKYFTEKE